MLHAVQLETSRQANVANNLQHAVHSFSDQHDLLLKDMRSGTEAIANEISREVGRNVLDLQEEAVLQVSWGEDKFS